MAVIFFATSTFALAPVTAIELPPPNVKPVAAVELIAPVLLPVHAKELAPVAVMELPPPAVKAVAAIELKPYLVASIEIPAAKQSFNASPEITQVEPTKQALVSDESAVIESLPFEDAIKPPRSTIPSDYDPAKY